MIDGLNMDTSPCCKFPCIYYPEFAEPSASVSDWESVGWRFAQGLCPHDLRSDHGSSSPWRRSFEHKNTPTSHVLRHRDTHWLRKILKTQSCLAGLVKVSFYMFHFASLRFRLLELKQTNLSKIVFQWQRSNIKKQKVWWFLRTLT